MPALLTRWIVLLVLGGIGAVIAGCLAYWSGQARTDEREDEGEQYAGGLRARNGPIPHVLMALYAGIAVAMIAYVAWVAGLANGF